MVSNASLGEARGRIVVDLSGLERAAQQVQTFARQMDTAFQQAGSGRKANVGSDIAQSMRRAQSQIQRASAELQSTFNRFGTARIGNALPIAEVERLQQAFSAAKQPILEAREALARMRDEATRLGSGASLDAFAGDMSRIDGLTGQVTAEMRVLTGEVANFERRAQQAATGARGYFNRLREDLERINEQGLGRNIQEIGFSLAPLSLAAGAGVMGGVERALDMEEVEISFRAITSSQREAQSLMQDLTNEARRFGLPVVDTLNAMQRLAPVVKRSGGDVRDYVGLVARLATLNPIQGVEGAVIAISEALSGSGNDFVSLTERFNIARATMRQAVRETGSVEAGLDKVLDSYGRTEDIALEFGETGRAAFRAFSDAVWNFLGAAMTPLLEALTPLVDKATDFLNTLNGMSPVIMGIVGGFLAITAAVSPLLIVVGNLIVAFETLKAARAAAFLGRAGAAGLGLGVGIAAGVGTAQFLADRGIGDQRLRSDSGEDAGAVIWERFRQAIVVVVDGLMQAGIALSGAIIELRLRFEHAFLGLIESVLVIGARMLDMIGLGAESDAIGLVAKNINDEQNERGAQIRFIETGGFEAQMRESARNAILRPLTEFLFPELRQVEAEMNPLASSLQSAIAEVGASISAFVGGLVETSREIAAVTADFNEQQARIDSDRALQAARDLEDAAIQRTRDIEAFNRALNDLDAGAVTRAAEDLSKLNSDLARMDSQSNQRRIEITRSYEEQRERSEEDHQRKLDEIRRQAQLDIKDAAAKLDAAGVSAAERRRDEQLSKENEQFDVQAARRREDYEQQITELNVNLEQQRAERIAAYQQQQVDQQAQYEQQRIRMIDDFNRRIQLEDADRALRMKRLAEDNALADKYRQEDLDNRIAQITEESNLWKQLETVISDTLSEGRRVINEALATYTAMVGAVASAASSIQASVGGGSGRGSATISEYQTGASRVPGGLAMLHAGEAVMNPQTAAIARSVLGAGFTQPQLARALTGNGGKSITMNAPITINGGSDDAETIALKVERAVRETLIQVFQS